MDRDINKNNQYTRDILTIINLLTLICIGSVYIEIFIPELKSGNMKSFQITYMYISIIVFILLLLYIMWYFFYGMKVDRPKIKALMFVKDLLFILTIIIAIFISGDARSDYKVIFLPVITVGTLRSGLRRGMVLATICSLLVIASDISFVPFFQIDHQIKYDIILVLIFFFTAIPLGYNFEIDRKYIQSLKDLANTDGLTGVFNHRYFYNMLEQQVEVAKKSLKPVALIFLDIDNFKLYNDVYGHQRGDDVLSKIGSILRESIRKKDIASRYGGEEFAVVLPDTDQETAIKIASMIRSEIERTIFYGEENQPNGRLTASIGVSVFPNEAEDHIELIKNADNALYRAKFFNKNRVEVYSSPLEYLEGVIKKEDDEVLIKSMKLIINIINDNDKYTHGHLERVVLYSRLLLEKLDLSKEDKEIFLYGAYMHDIGKINIPSEILLKKEKLTDDEWNILKKHSEHGVKILKEVEGLSKLESIVLHHHESYDGKGYPHGLKGEEIPYLARALTIVDSFDAMTAKRPYSEKKTYDEAISEIRRCSGTQFDPDLVEKFIEAIEEKRDIAEYKI